MKICRALMLLSRPGLGKDEMFLKYIKLYPGLATYPLLCGLSRPMATYKLCYDNQHRLLIISDGEGLWASDNGKELVRQLSEQKHEKRVGWPTTSKQLEGYPQHFVTTSRVAFILNRWIDNPADPFYDKILDRSNVYHFDPPPAEIHFYVSEWFFDQEVFDFIADHLHHVVESTLAEPTTTLPAGRLAGSRGNGTSWKGTPMMTPNGRSKNWKMNQG